MTGVPLETLHRIGWGPWLWQLLDHKALWKRRPLNASQDCACSQSLSSLRPCHDRHPGDRDVALRGPQNAQKQTGCLAEPRRPLLSASASPARSRSSSRSASRQEKAEQGRNAKSRISFWSLAVAFRGRAMFAPGGRIDFATAAAQPHAATRSGAAAPSIAFPLRFCGGPARLLYIEHKTTPEIAKGDEKTKKRSLLRGAAGLLLDSAAPRHLGPELRADKAELSVARADGRCSYRLATPGAPGAGPWPTTPRGGKAVPPRHRVSRESILSHAWGLRRGYRTATSAWRARTKDKPTAPSCAVSSCQDCVRGTFNQRRGCTSRVPVTVSRLGFGLELLVFWQVASSQARLIKFNEGPAKQSVTAVLQSLRQAPPHRPGLLESDQSELQCVLMTGCEFKLQ